MKRFVLAMLVFCLCPSTYADFLGVEDLKLIEQSLEQIDCLKKQLKELKAHKQRLEESKRLLEDSKKLMEGHYQYSNLFDDQNLTRWRHTANRWEALLKSYEGKSKGDFDELSVIASQLEKEFPIEKSSNIYSNKNSEQAKLFDLLSKTTIASNASNISAYNNVDRELIMLEQLQREIEKSPNQKATLDLIARIQIEQAKMIAHKAKTDSINAQLNALHAQEEISDAKWAAKFLKWH